MTHPILLLHGALGSAPQLDPLKKLLEEKGATVYSVTFRSHGGVPPSSKGFGVEVFAEEVLAFLDEQALECVHVFGYSMGGYVALWLAQLHPSRFDRIVTLGTKFDWSVEAAEKEVKKLNPEKIQEKVPAFAKVLEERHQPGDWKKLMNQTATMMKALGEKPLLTPSVFSSIQINTLVCLGDQDDMVDRPYSMEVSTFLPNASFKLLHETPHLLERTDLTMLTNTLTNFFV